MDNFGQSIGEVFDPFYVFYDIVAGIDLYLLFVEHFFYTGKLIKIFLIFFPENMKIMNMALIIIVFYVNHMKCHTSVKGVSRYWFFRN